MTTTTAVMASAVRGRSRRLARVGGGLAAWMIGLLFFAPVAWMLLTSLHSETDAAQNPPALFAGLTFDSYSEFLTGSGQSPLPFFINSAVSSILSTLLVLGLATPAAYALSIRSVRKWQDTLFFFLTTKMLPIVAGLLPIYLLAKALGILDTNLLLIVLYTAANLPIAVWMMRSFLSEIPVEILEAASMDGASLFYKFVRIIVPLSGPGLAATALICFIFSWNELLLANALTSTIAATAPVFLTSFVTGQGLFLSKVCAASMAVSLPVLIAGFAAQDKLVQGLSLGAVK